MLNHRSAAKRATLREQRWSNSKDKIWPPPSKGEDGKKGEGGWARVPRTISVIGRVFFENSKGVDLLPTYIELLSRNPEEGIVEIGHEEEHAALSGFTPNPRGVKSWRTRLSKLKELGFIRLFEGARGVDLVIMVHPTIAMKELHDKGLVSEPLWYQFNKFLIDTGAWRDAGDAPLLDVGTTELAAMPAGSTAPAPSTTASPPSAEDAAKEEKTES